MKGNAEDERGSVRVNRVCGCCAVPVRQKRCGRCGARRGCGVRAEVVCSVRAVRAWCGLGVVWCGAQWRVSVEELNVTSVPFHHHPNGNRFKTATGSRFVVWERVAPTTCCHSPLPHTRVA